MTKAFVLAFCLFSSTLLFGQYGIYSGTAGADSVFLFLWEEQDADMDRPTVHAQFYDREEKAFYMMKGWENDGEIVLQQYPIIPGNAVLSVKISRKSIRGKVERESGEVPLNMQFLYGNESTGNETLLPFLSLCTSTLQFEKSDSLFYTDSGITLRYYRETSLDILLFRVESGLSDDQLKGTNAMLENIHKEIYISKAWYRSEKDSTVYFLSNPFFGAGLLSFAVNVHYLPNPDQGDFDSMKRMFSIILDVEQQKKLQISDILVGKAFETDASQPYKESTYWQALLKAYFRKTNPEEARKCDHVINHEWEPEKSTLLLTKNGFRILSRQLVDDSCFNPSWAVIPYAETQLLLKPEIYRRLQTIKP